MANPVPSSEEPIELIVEPSQSGWRLDLFLVHHFSDYSRALIRKMIMAGGSRIDDHGGKPAYRLKPGQCVRFTLPEIPREVPLAEDIPLDIIYEDDWLAVINKPSGMVVHPARGHWSGTLASALQFHFGGKLSSMGGPTRPGIVHRLDRDTSGAILIAKNDLTHAKLAKLFHDRDIEKHYFAIVQGNTERDRDVVDEPIGPHPRIREQMAIRRGPGEGKAALTFYEILERFRGFATVRCRPKSGRTHQIRVHMTHAGSPILCDRLYGGRAKLTRGELLTKVADDDIILERQALHAELLSFRHPESGRDLTIKVPLPEDLTIALDAIRELRKL